MMLDRGEQLGWFESPEIWIEMILAIVGFYFFLADCLTSERPFISVRIFKDWNFSIALVFMFLVGIMLLASMALVTPFIQNLLNYPVLSSGFLLGTRGIGTFVGMFLVGRTERQGRSSDHDPHRPRARVLVALPHGRLDARRPGRTRS